MQLNLAKGFLLLITPIAPLALVSTPLLAATLGTSQSTVNINDFSHTPLDVSTLTDNVTDTFASNGFVNAKANAVANFITNNPPSANNSSFSEVNGNGSAYFGSAKSTAAVIGYDFIVNKNETFSFSFDAALNLATSIESPQSEAVNAVGNITLELYDTTNQANWLYLDSFTLESGLTTRGDNDYLNYDNSNSIKLNPIILDTAFGGNQESAKGEFQGSFSRSFDDLTSLTLVEVKNNQASVSVPEPSSLFGLLLGVIGMGYRITSRAVSWRLGSNLKQ